MTTKPTLVPQPPRQQQALPPPPPLLLQGSDAALEIQIDQAARKIIATPMPPEARQQALAELLRQRAHLLTTPPFEGGTFFLDITQIGQPPTPLCPYYKRARVPTVSTYHFIGPNLACIRLHKSALEHIPQAVLEKAGDLTGKEVDLFWTAIDARWLAQQQRCFNLCAHPWTHPHALIGDDVKKDILMGIFPEIGFAPHSGEGAIAVHRLSPMSVHTHEERYSPDNAHFERIPGSPFGLVWSVLQSDNRTAITRMLVLFDFNDPISQSLLPAIRDSRNLETHLNHLAAVRGAIQQTFGPLITTLENDLAGALEGFQRLPPAFQEGVFRQTWILKGSPLKIHDNFGEASFLHATTLSPQHHCNPGERGAAVRQFAVHLTHLLLDSQRTLLNAQPLVRGDNVLQMMQCADHLSKGELQEGYALFERLDKKEQSAVFFALWEISGCPRGNFHFGSETFSLPTTPGRLKQQAVLLAASRQTPTFAQPIPATSREGVKEALLAMLFDPSFQTLDKTTQKERVMGHLNRLDPAVKNTLFAEVYHHSTDPQKGGPSWGEIHCVDHLDVFLNALMTAIP